MQNRDLIENAFKILMALLMSLCLYILKDFGGSLDKMQESINSLNVSIASMSERLIGAAANDTRLEKRIEKLENKVERIRDK